MVPAKSTLIRKPVVELRIRKLDQKRREPIDQVIKPIYAELLAIENRHENRKDGMHAAVAALTEKLKGAGVSYDEFIFSI